MRSGPRLWRRKQNGNWYVEIEGRQIRLGTDESEAWRKFHSLTDGEQLSDFTPAVQVMDAFLESVKEDKSQRTFEWYQRFLVRFRKHIGDRLTVRDLRPYHVTRWIQRKKWSPTTRNMAVRAVKRAFSWAAKEGYIVRSPITAASAPAADRRETIITPNEWQRIIGAVPDQEFRDMLTVLRETGCRPQEVRAVEARHVRDGRWVFGRAESKGKKDQRIVYLSDATNEITQRLASKYPEGPIFRNRRGRVWTHNAVVLRFKRLRENLNLDKITAYTIRHTFATEALERGVDPISVALLMGHKDATMIARVYQHLTQKPEHMRKKLRQATGSADSG